MSARLRVRVCLAAGGAGFLLLAGGLERLLGDRFRFAVLRLLSVAPTPNALRKLGEAGIHAVLREGDPRTANSLTPEIVAVLDEQTV